MRERERERETVFTGTPGYFVPFQGDKKAF
jgi:hypothetical protein